MLQPVEPKPSDFTVKFKLPDGTIDHVKVQERWTELMTIFNNKKYTMEEYPGLCAEAIECTRILRKTNTGPAKPRTTGSRKKTVELSESTKALLMGDD